MATPGFVYKADFERHEAFAETSFNEVFRYSFRDFMTTESLEYVSCACIDMNWVLSIVV